MSAVTAPDPYDQLPYTDHAYAESHPDRLSVVARLSGWEPPAVVGARILELGCGRGGNLLPIAAGLPGARLVGVDRAARQIEEATAIARAVRLDNVELVASPVERFEPDQAFDFIICHGLCSWVPPATRRSLLATIGSALAPGGVAYVSFNCLPGWYERLAARDWLRSFPGTAPPASLAWLRDAISPELADYRRRIDAITKRLEETDAAYARHEYLAEEHHPQLVSELLAEAGKAGLAYLGDAIPSGTALELLPKPVSERASALGVAAGQQVIDFVQCTAFRRALFVRRADAEARAWTHPAHLDRRALDSLRIRSRLRPHDAADPQAGTERFDGPGGLALLQSAPGVRRVLHQLARVAPRSMPFAELASAAAIPPGELRDEAFDLWLATGTISLHVREPGPPEAETARRDHPEAAALARWHAAHGGALTNRWHEEVELDDPLLRTLLARLDGSRSVDDLARELGQSGPTATLDTDARLQLLRACLEVLASAGLLVD
jgi:SAM-dependent methyltransferase